MLLREISVEILPEVISEEFCFYLDHGLRTPNEGINQRYLKNWADVADKNMLRPYLKIWDWG